MLKENTKTYHSHTNQAATIRFVLERKTKEASNHFSWCMNIAGEAFPNFMLQPGGVLMKHFGKFCAHDTVMLISSVATVL